MVHILNVVKGQSVTPQRTSLGKVRVLHETTQRKSDALQGLRRCYTLQLKSSFT